MMKKILITLAIFLSMFFAADRVFMHFFSKHIFSNTLSGESGGSLNYLLKKKRNIDFIILGSSRAKHQIDPKLLTNLHGGNGYNAGINGVGTIIYNSILLDILVKDGIVPKAVILQTDNYQFNVKQLVNPETEIIPLYPFIDQSTLLKGYLSYSEQIKLALRSYRYNGKFLNIVYNYFKRHSISENTGFVGLPVAMNSTSLAIKPVTTPEKMVISKSRIKALEDIVQLCSKNNIKLIVIFPPFFNSSTLFKEDNKRLFIAMRQVGVENLLDLSDSESIPAMKHAAMWKDVGHLNSTGAIILSNAINQHF